MIAVAGALSFGVAAGLGVWGLGKTLNPNPARDFWDRLVVRPRRVRLMRLCLPDGLNLMAGSVRAGASLVQALGALAREGPEPLRGECGRLVAEQGAGRDLDKALESLAARYGMDELNLAVAGIRLSRRSGTDLAGTLEEAAALTRSKIETLQKVRALSAQGVLSAWVMALLPPLLLFGMAALDRDFVSPLVDTLEGRKILAFALVWEILGAFWISRVIKSAGR